MNFCPDCEMIVDTEGKCPYCDAELEHLGEDDE